MWPRLNFSVWMNTLFRFNAKLNARLNCLDIFLSTFYVITVSLPVPCLSVFTERLKNQDGKTPLLPGFLLEVKVIQENQSLDMLCLHFWKNWPLKLINWCRGSVQSSLQRYRLNEFSSWFRPPGAYQFCMHSFAHWWCLSCIPSDLLKWVYWLFIISTKWLRSHRFL